MKEEKIWQLVSLKLSGEATPVELSELQELIDENPELHLRIKLIEDFWNSKSETPQTLDTAFNKHLQRLSNHFATPALQYDQDNAATTVIEKKAFTSKNKLLWISSIAASFIIILSLVYLSKSPKASSNLSKNIVATKPGSKSKISLPDGSQVWLNSESKLTYGEKFGENTREVELIGEAFFDVVKDKSRPFIIHTNSIDVKVLGTAFNVRSYPNEKNS